MTSILDNPPPPEPSRGHRKARADLDKRMPVGAKLVGGEGDITLEVEEAPRDTGWDWILEHHPAVSPETHEIDETVPVEVGSWEMGYVTDGEADSKTLYRYKAKVRLRKPGERLTRPHLDELVKTVRRRKAIAPPENTGPWLVVSLADWQVGKALADDTPIFTPDGWTTHGALKPGDRVFDPDGKPIMVTHVTGSTMQDAYRVNFDGSAPSIVASGEHIWEVQFNERHHVKGGGGAVRFQREVRQFTTSELAAQPRHKLERSRIPLHAPAQLDNCMPAPFDPYIYGAWLGDGASGRTSVVMTSHIDDAANMVDQIGHDAYVRPIGGRPNTVDVCVPRFGERFRDAGIDMYGKDAIPEWTRQLSARDSLRLLQGLMDTDGTVSPNGLCEFNNTRKCISDLVEYLATGLGLKVRRAERVPTLNGMPCSTDYRVRFTPDSRFDEPVFTLPRKAARLMGERKRDEHRYRYIQSVDAVEGQVSCQCITVEGGLYLAGEHMVTTHNSDFGGTPVLIERLTKTFDDLRAKVRKLKPAGVTLVDLGDICEQVSCFYDSQTYTVDLNLTEQIEVATELFIAAVEAVADLTPRVLVGAVPSNHGEFRVAKGTVVTDRARDNIDLVIANNMARVFAANPDRYGHVEVWTPPKDGGDPYVLTLDMDGVIVGFSHGHQVRAMGKGRMAGLEQWWQNHQWSDRKRPRGDSLPTIADADIVVLGHGHTLLVSEQTGKLLIQAPAAESGSEYFSTSTGNRSSSGTLTFQVSEQWPLLANGFEIL